MKLPLIPVAKPEPLPVLYRHTTLWNVSRHSTQHANKHRSGISSIDWGGGSGTSTSCCTAKIRVYSKPSRYVSYATGTCVQSFPARGLYTNSPPGEGEEAATPATDGISNQQDIRHAQSRQHASTTFHPPAYTERSMPSRRRRENRKLQWEYTSSSE